MKTFIRILLLCWISAVRIAGASAVEPASPIDLTLLHVNDLHGHLLPHAEKSLNDVQPVGGAAFLAALMGEERARNPEGTLLLAAGDMFQGAPVSNVFRGRPVIQVMNHLQFDAMALGNHEFDWGRQALGQLVAEARFPFLSANIVDEAGHGIDGVKPYVIVERKGLRIAVIGVTTPETVYSTNPKHVAGLRFLDPVDVLPPLLAEVKGQGAHLIVVLSHLGLAADQKLAAAVSGLDVIVGGHSHTAMTRPLEVNGAIIVQAGCHGAYLGVLRLKFDPQSRKIIDYSRDQVLKSVETGPGAPSDPDVASLVASAEEAIGKEFSRVVGETLIDLIRNPIRESNVGNLIADAMRESAGTDIAVMNGGGIRADLNKGPITLSDIHVLLPFDNVLTSMDLTGEQVLQVLEKNALLQQKCLQVSGLTVVYDTSKPEGARVVSASVQGKPLQRETVYRVAVNDFLAAGGDRFTTFQEGDRVTFGDDLRDVLVDTLQKHSPVNPTVENRIVFLKAIP